MNRSDVRVLVDVWIEALELQGLIMGPGLALCCTLQESDGSRAHCIQRRVLFRCTWQISTEEGHDELREVLLEAVTA